MEDILSRIADAIKSAEKLFGLDWRSSYSKLSFDPSGTLSVEVSRREIFEFLAKELKILHARDSSAKQALLFDLDGCPVRIELLGSSGYRSLWAASSVVDVRREPAHSSELLTQMIMGESGELLKTEGDWHLVRLEDDYHGWIRSWYAREAGSDEIAEYNKRCNAVVEANVACVFSQPDRESIPVSDIVAGVRLISGKPEGNFRRVELPGQRIGFMLQGDLSFENPEESSRRMRIVERAKRFLGIPYLWGGASPKGFDCSGLVKRVFSMVGVFLPRDSDQQALVGSLIPRERIDSAAPADLIFFGDAGKVSHVAICIGERRFVHSSGEVKIGSLSPGDSMYDEKLHEKVLFGRSVIN